MEYGMNQTKLFSLAVAVIASLISTQAAFAQGSGGTAAQTSSDETLGDVLSLEQKLEWEKKATELVKQKLERAQALRKLRKENKLSGMRLAIPSHQENKSSFSTSSDSHQTTNQRGMNHDVNAILKATHVAAPTPAAPLLELHLFKVERIQGTLVATVLLNDGMLKLRNGQNINPDVKVKHITMDSITLIDHERIIYLGIEHKVTGNQSSNTNAIPAPTF